jgi:hypothetical protein
MEEARIPDLGGILGKLDVSPGDHIAKGPVPEGPSSSLGRFQIGVGDLLEYSAPLSLQAPDPFPDTLAAARP